MVYPIRGATQKNPSARKIVVIGVGNLLLKDEGVGVHAALELQEKALPPGVEVFDGGGGGTGLLDLFQGAGKAVIIDAADMTRPPGTVVRFTPDEVRSRAGGPKLSAHEVGLLEVLELARALGQCPPEVVIIGVQPGEISWGMDLTPEVQAALPRVLKAVSQEMNPATEDLEEKI